MKRIILAATLALTCLSANASTFKETPFEGNVTKWITAEDHPYMLSVGPVKGCLLAFHYAYKDFNEEVVRVGVAGECALVIPEIKKAEGMKGVSITYNGKQY